VSQLKIDGSFVSNMATDEEDAAIVASTIDLARSLGLSVVAEGVESETVWQQLLDFGCDFVQGYYLSRPLTADQMTRWLEQRESDRRGDEDRTAAKVLSLGSARATALGPSA
jgi:EAL domain-containing protein (putative c-di-GMP-specific phosphodiesterase class I)